MNKKTINQWERKLNVLDEVSEEKRSSRRKNFFTQIDYMEIFIVSLCGFCKFA